MAKTPVPGQVKTRLIDPLTAHQAAAVHAAMLECVLERLATHLPGRRVLAIDGAPGALNDKSSPDLSLKVPVGTEVINQGTGNLGQRIHHVWQASGSGPAVFFGVDSPDCPAEALTAIPQALESHDAACGPVDDGGYWCLAARRPAPALLADIDWGSPSVYHQTQSAASEAGLTLAELPAWHDVDTPSDLSALTHRLRSAHEPALTRLAERLSRVLQD